MENGQLVVKDGFVSGMTTGDDTWADGLIGSLVEDLGGQLGSLLGGSKCMLIGVDVDAENIGENTSVLEKVGDCIIDGETAII